MAHKQDPGGPLNSSDSSLCVSFLSAWPGLFGGRGRGMPGGAGRGQMQPDKKPGRPQGGMKNQH